MAGRFPLYTDADVNGDIVKALRRAGWDLVRAVDEFPEDTPDPIHFARAAELNRALVANDVGQKNRAIRWIRDGRAFRGMIWWPQDHQRVMTPGDFLRRFEELAAMDDPFAAYKVIYIKTSR